MNYSLPPALRRRAQRGLGIPLFGLLALLLIPLLASSLQAATWYRYQAYDLGSEGSSVALDPQHRPHIFYYASSFSPQRLVHSVWDGSGWQREVVDSCSDYHNAGPAVEFDALGRIHVAYFNRAYHLGYALYDGAWHIETVDTAASTGDWCDLALDSSNQPHIAYAVTNTRRLRYAVKNGSWQIYQDDSGAGGTYVSLKLDTLGYPHISDCTSWSGGVLRYVYQDTGGWHVEQPAGGTSNVSGYNSLALDQLGRPQISYYWADGTNYDLRYATKNSGAWQNYTVDHGLQPYKRGWDNHIACDPGGQLHIVYLAHNEAQLKHAAGSGSNWSAEVVDAVGMWNSDISFKLDSRDLFISYYNEGTGVNWLAVTRSLSGVEQGPSSRLTLSPSRLTVFPNPFTSFARVPGRGGERFSLYDVSGRKAGTYPGSCIGKGLPPGVYFLRSEDQNAKPVRIVKVR